MTTRWETDGRRDRLARYYDGPDTYERRAKAARESKELFLSFVKNLERNWALSMALILAACIVLSIV